MDSQTKEKLASVVMELETDIHDEEELIELLKDTKVAQDLSNRSPNLSIGQKSADKITLFAGSWTFILAFLAFLIFWIVFNRIHQVAFDPFPFILLNLILSCIAAIQAPIILMSQNRQAERDRSTAKNDFKINLKSEIILEDMHDRLVELQKRTEELSTLLDKLK